MSTAVRWIIALLVVAVLAWLVWWSGWLTKPHAAVNQQQQAQATTTAQQPQNGMSANNDASDAGISQDTAAIDAQMKAYDADSAAVDAGMNDKEVTQ
jgi:hypothetical protein